MINALIGFGLGVTFAGFAALIVAIYRRMDREDFECTRINLRRVR